MKGESEAVLTRLEQGKLPWGAVFTDKMVSMEWSKESGWTKAEIKDYGNIVLSPAASVLHYGMEIFEGLKAYKSESGQVRLFRPQLNIRRMNLSAKRVALPEIDEEAMLQTMKHYVASQKHWVPSCDKGALYIRACLIATEDRIGVKASDKALFFIIACPVGSFFSQKKGVKLWADDKYVRAWKGGVGNCKTGGNYAMSIMPTEEAKKKGYEQILWLSGDEKKVTEAGMMNVFFVFEGEEGWKVVTPKLDGLILDGVNRRSVIEVVKMKGWGMEEREIRLEEVSDCVEVFGTGTGGGICPVGEIGAPGGVVWNGDGVGVADAVRAELMKIWGGPQHRWMVDVEDMDADALH